MHENILMLCTKHMCSRPHGDQRNVKCPRFHKFRLPLEAVRKAAAAVQRFRVLLSKNSLLCGQQVSEDGLCLGML